MSTTSTYDEDEQARIARQQFEALQAGVVNLRNAVIILRASTLISFRRYRQTKAQLKRSEAELTRLHKMLHPDEE
ncbi:MAG: hypothetical protein WAV98_02515 [Minisyncoccia bacterium]